jgi:hypothetical protein
MDCLKHAPPEYQRYFVEPEGVEHYRLLEQLTSDMDGQIVVDVGTLYGLSAFAMSRNPNVEVWTYDIQSFIPDNAPIKKRPNISFRIKNGIEAIPDFVDKTTLIMLDIDPHDGTQERQFIDALVEHKYTGQVVCDDIHLNDAMKSFWDSVTQRKEVRKDGHHSGTGIIYFEC